jgi:FkbM family methyltransferase
VSVSKLKARLKDLLWRSGLDVRFAAAHDPLRAQKRLLQDVDVQVVVDGGGNNGEWTSNYRRAFPRARVLVFEPFPPSVEGLERAFSGDPKVKVIGKALGEAAAKKVLFCNKLSATNSLFPIDPAIHSMLPDPQWVAPESEIATEVTTLDDYCREAAINRVNVLKLDIQGAELLALRGAERLLSKGAVDLVYTELLFHPHYQGQAFFFEIAQYLHQHRYTPHGFYNFATNASGRMWQADAIFVGPNLAAA